MTAVCDEGDETNEQEGTKHGWDDNSNDIAAIYVRTIFGLGVKL